MAVRTRIELQQDLTTYAPDNSTNEISAMDLRILLDNIIDSLVLTTEQRFTTAQERTLNELAGRPNIVISARTPLTLQSGVAASAGTVGEVSDAGHRHAIVVPSAGLNQSQVDQRINTLIPNASTTARGKVELATNTESSTGTDLEKAVTPRGLTQYHRDHRVKVADRAAWQAINPKVSDIMYWWPV